MAWKPKTIAGKIIKGTVIAGGSILGLAAGAGAIGGVVKGVGLLAGGKKGLVAVKNVIDKVGAGAANLVTGTTKVERDILRDFKDRTRDEQHKLALYEKYKKAGATEAEAAAAAGITQADLPSEERNLVQGSKKNNTLLYAGAGLLALFLLPKLFKR